MDIRQCWDLPFFSTYFCCYVRVSVDSNKRSIYLWKRSGTTQSVWNTICRCVSMSKFASYHPVSRPDITQSPFAWNRSRSISMEINYFCTYLEKTECCLTYLRAVLFNVYSTWDRGALSTQNEVVHKEIVKAPREITSVSRKAVGRKNRGR